MKKNLYSLRMSLRRMLVLTLGLVLGASLFAQDITDGLEFQYKFDNSEEGITSDAIAGAGGILQNGAYVDVVDGLNALVLTGGSNADGPYMEFDPALVAALQTYNNVTISLWTKIYDLPIWSRLFDMGTGTSVNMFLTPSNGGTARFAITTGGNGSEGRVDAGKPLEANVWTHIALTIQDNIGSLYINGELAGSNALELNPSSFTETLTQCYIGRSQYTADNNLNAAVSDFRIYSRGLDATEVEAIGSDPALAALGGFKITDIPENASIDINDLDQDITLQTEFDNDVTAEWEFPDTTYIDSLGHFKGVRPELYPVPVAINVTFFHTAGGIQRAKTVSTLAYVQPETPGPELVAQWDFNRDNLDVDGVSIADISGNELTGTMVNEAWLRTIGETTQYDVLDLGEGTGYFDMSAELGEYIHQLGEYTISLFFRVHEDYTYAQYGNFFYTFCNTEDIYDGGGAMYFIGGGQQHDIMPTDYNTAQSTGGQGPAPQGAWHHLAFVQEGTTGTVYIDGELLSEATITLYPYSTIKKDSANGVALTGTPFNWLGRSPYPSDGYLQNTAMYDFRLYSKPLTQEEIKLSNPFGIGLDVLTVKDELDAAWAENDNAGFPSELATELEALSPGDISAITSDLPLPAQGSIDNTISITWESAPALIGADGTVTRPDYLDTDVRLTATLSKDGYRVDTTFMGTVLANEATKYTSDLLIHFNFDSVNVEGNVVTDLSEQKFEGTFINGSYAKQLYGIEKDFGVLRMWNDSAYFDMGDEVGKVMVALNGNFSISTHFFVDPLKDDFSSNGNFLYAFSNSDSSDTYQTGYIFGRATTTTYALSPKRWDNGQVGTTGGAEPTMGEWHHYAYVQDDTLGVMYVDGIAIDTSTIKLLPNEALAKPGMLGTTYNFLGRPNFTGDVMLNNAMMYDFKVYNKILTEAEVVEMSDLSDDIWTAYLLTPVPVKQVRVEEDYRVDTSIPGLIRIHDLKGNEKVSVYNLTGRQVTVKNAQNIAVQRGIYIVKVNSTVKKVLVK